MSKKILAVIIILLFIVTTISPSTGKDIEHITTNYTFESDNGSKVLSACDHLVYFGGDYNGFWDCWLYEGRLNEILNSSCLCY